MALRHVTGIKKVDDLSGVFRHVVHKLVIDARIGFQTEKRKPLRHFGRKIPRLCGRDA